MSVNRQFVFGMLAGVVVVALLLFSVWMATGRPVTPLSPRPEAIRQAPPAFMSGRQVVRQHADPIQAAPVAPPWMGKDALQPPARVAPGLPPMQGVPMTAAGKVDLDAVNSRIDALIKRHGGNPVIRGVDFSVLKQNLVKAKELQSLAEQMQVESRQKTPDVKKIQALAQRVKEIQSQIQINFTMPAGNAASAPAP